MQPPLPLLLGLAWWGASGEFCRCPSLRPTPASRSPDVPEAKAGCPSLERLHLGALSSEACTERDRRTLAGCLST